MSRRGYRGNFSQRDTGEGHSDNWQDDNWGDDGPSEQAKSNNTYERNSKGNGPSMRRGAGRSYGGRDDNGYNNNYDDGESVRRSSYASRGRDASSTSYNNYDSSNKYDEDHPPRFGGRGRPNDGGFDGGRGGGFRGDRSGGFGGSRGGMHGRGDDDTQGERGFGRSRGGMRGRGDDDTQGDRGFGGSRGGMRGGRGDDNPQGDRGFGGSRGGMRGGRGDDVSQGDRGFGGSRGGMRGRRDDDRNNYNGDRSGGFRGGMRGRGGNDETNCHGDSRGRARGSRRFDGQDNNFNDRFSKSVNIDDEEDGNDDKSYGGESRMYRNSRRGDDGDDGNEGENGEMSRAPVTYIPPEFDESEESLFSRGIRQGINFDQYDKVKVKVTGGCESIKPVDSFDQLPLQLVLKENIKRCEYKRPTPIQRFALPILLQNRDIMACAQTGSGKTAAFILPIFDRILRDDLYASVTTDDRMRCCHPLALVIVPTRELVTQTYAECKKFSYQTRIRTAQVYGGVSVAHQLSQLRIGNEIVVGTTGRLLDVIRRGAICLDNCVFLVLDEADRMLDMGFEPDVREIIKSGGMAPVGDPLRRCTAMFSATFPPEVQTLAQDFLCHDYSFITVGVVGGACRDVTQEILSVDRGNKRNKLKEILGDLGEAKTLIFVEQKRFADFLASDLNQSGFQATSIHGDRLQKEREEALRDFVRGKMPYLVATSVAARGLDIPGVDNVINYDLPDSITEYVHRIGRTGRCGNPGKSISFYDQADERCTRLAGSLVNVLTDANQHVPDFLSGRYFAAEVDEFSHTARQDIRGSENYHDRSKKPQHRCNEQQPAAAFNEVVNVDEDSWD